MTFGSIELGWSLCFQDLRIYLTDNLHLPLQLLFGRLNYSLVVVE